MRQLPSILIKLLGLCLLLVAPLSCSAPGLIGWRKEVRQSVLSLGYGNWVVIADASYPHHNKWGVDVINVSAEVPEVVDALINEIESTQHVKPLFYLPRELRLIAQEQAPGIELYRDQLKASLHGHAPRELEERILNGLVKTSAEEYNVLVIKTQTSLPYSSVFIEMDSGYWDTDAEIKLREAIQRENQGQ